MEKLPDRITIDKNILQGKPTIRGLRISASQIMSALAAGISQEEILADYPELEREDLRAVMLYAANLVEETRIYTFSD
ncbi:MAG: DUF433 domain-containing protein, partial [Chloroflexota bacterium]